MKRWPRWVEIFLGGWLIASPSVLAASPVANERVLGALIAFAAAAAFKRDWENIHWFGCAGAIMLVLMVYFGAPMASPLAQSDIVTGLVILMTSILPTRALEPPQGRMQ